MCADCTPTISPSSTTELLSLHGKDLRQLPLEKRKPRLVSSPSGLGFIGLVFPIPRAYDHLFPVRDFLERFTEDFRFGGIAQSP